MNQISYKWPVSGYLKSGIVLIVGAAIALYQFIFYHKQGALYFLFILFILTAFIFIDLFQSPTLTIINGDDRTVSMRRRILSSKTVRIDRFSGIRSYVSGIKANSIILELMPSEGEEHSLTIAIFEAIPFSSTEPEECKQLRKSVATICKMRDFGFSTSRPLNKKV